MHNIRQDMNKHAANTYMASDHIGSVTQSQTYAN